MKKTGKWLAKLLAVALLMNLLPVFAMAADTKDSTPGNSVFLTRVDWLAGTAQVKNRSDTTVTARFILAAYDANGRMIGKSTADERTLEAGESAELTVKIPAGAVAERLKVFVLDTATGAPLCQALERVRSAELIVDKAGTVTGGTYQYVTITSAVGDGEVTLKDVTINDELMIQGGGSNSIKLVSCHVNGRVAMEKPVGTQTPRLELTDTPLGKVVANQPAIIEAVDTASAIQLVKVSANVEIRGSKTIVHEITAAAPVRIADGIVNTITVPDTAQTQVAVTVESHAFVGEIAVHSPSGAAITNDGSVNALSAADAEAAKKITLGGSSHTPAPTAHIHSWDGGVWAVQPACDVCGELTRTCTVDGCGAVKSETVLPLGHALGSGYDSNETGHWHTCQRCGQHAEKAAHVYAGTNCAEADVCAVCGYEKPAGAHSWDEGVVTKEPTFTEPGEKTYTCTSCGATMTTQKHPLAGEDQLMLIESAEKRGLLTYLTLNDLGGVTRLEMAKLLAAFRNLNLDDAAPAEYGDCAGLTEQEKRIVGAAVNRNLMAPYQDGTFRPEDQMTRAAAAEVFYRLLDQPVTDCTAQFADVEQGAWYWAAVTNLYNFGLITGTSANTFSPNAPADKEALLSWLVCGKDWNDPRPAVPTVENAWFAKTPAAIALCIQQPADMSEIDYFRLELKGSDGTWVDYGTFTGDWVDIHGERLDGTYTRIKITSVPKDPSRYAKGVWKMDCALTVVNQKLAAPDDVTFSKIMAGNTISGYSVEVQGLSPNTDQVIVQLTAKENGYGLRSYMAGNIFANETAAGKDVRITLFTSYPTELLPDGYYRVLEVLDASVTDDTTASLTVNSRGDWEKVPPLKVMTDPRPAVPAVKGFAFLKSPAALELQVQQPDDMSGINCFSWEFQDAAGNWVDLGTFTGRPPILGDDMNGVYSRIRITSIPKDEAQYRPGVLEAPCQLTIENEQAGAPDAVTFTGFTEADGIPRFRAQVHGLQSDTDQAVIQLSARANGRGRRSEIAGNRFFDDNGTTKSFSVAVRAEHFLGVIPGGYYRVLEVKEAAVTDDSTAYLKVRTRGDWEQVELQGGSAYEPVSNLRFEWSSCPALAWERPTGDSDDTQYSVFLSADGGASWLYAHSSRGKDFLPPYICTEGSYNAVKVVTRVNGYDVASCVDTDLRLDISRGSPLTGVQLSLEPLSNGEMRCTISGLAPYTSHTLFMGSEPGSYRSSMGVFADENGTWTQKGKYFADGMYYYIQEYSNSSISADGKTASFTVRGMSDWEQAALQGGEEVKAATIKDVYYVDVVWSDSKNVAGSASTAYYAQLVNLYSGLVSEVVLEKRDHEVAGIDADLSVADLAALAGKLVTISDKKDADSKKDNGKFNLKSWSDKDWDVTAVSAFDKDFTKSLTRITGDGKTYRLDGDTKYLFLEDTKKDLDVSVYTGGVAFSRDKVNSAIILTEDGKTLAKYVVILTDDADQIFEFSEDIVFVKSVSRERGDGYISQTVYLSDGSKETWQIDDGESYSGGKFYTYRTNSDGFCELDEADAMEVAKNFVWSDEEGVILNATIAKDALYGTLLTVTAGGYTVSDIETDGAEFVDLHDTDDDGAYDRSVNSLSRLCDLVDDGKVSSVEMFLNVSRDGAVTIFVTAINMNLQGGSAYEPVSNLRFEKFHGCLRLTWDTPASQPDGAVYRTYLSQDGGASWRELYASEWNFMVPGYRIPAGTYDRVKVATLVNGHEVTAAEEAISLTVTEGVTLPAASLTLSPITGGGYACTVTGLTPEASFGLFFRSADGTDDDHVGILRADSAGNCTDTLRINERVTAYYRIDEYSNSAISADGKTASYTASSRGGWIPVELQGGEEVKAATIKDVYYVDVVWSDSKIVAGSASTTYYAQLVNLYSGFVSEVVMEKRDHEVAGIDADLSVADLAALAGKLVTISDKKVGDSKKDNDKFNLKSWSDDDWDVTTVAAFDKDFTKSLTRIAGDGKTYRLDGSTKYLFLEDTKKDLDVSGYIGGVAFSKAKVNSAIILTEDGKTLAKYVVILTDDADQIFEYSEDEVFIKSVSRERGDGYISQTVYLPDGSKEIWQIDDGEFYTKGKFYNYGTNSNGYYELDEADAMEVAKNFVWDDEEGVVLNATIGEDALYGTLLTVKVGAYTVSDIETKGAKFVDLHDTDDTGAYDRTVGSLSRLCDLVDDGKVSSVEMFLNVSEDGAVTIFVTAINV